MENNNSSFSLYSRTGQRKYLNDAERKRFYDVTLTKEVNKQLFLLTLYYSGARISEVLNLKAIQIDPDDKVIIIESLKKRRTGVFRAIPLPHSMINSIHQLSQVSPNNENIFSFPRRTATRYVRQVMAEAGIEGAQACSRGLRHSFAVSAIQNNVPLSLIKTWMGHSSLSTTEIYLNVMGSEERKFAERMW